MPVSLHLIFVFALAMAGPAPARATENCAPGFARMVEGAEHPPSVPLRVGAPPLSAQEITTRLEQLSGSLYATSGYQNREELLAAARAGDAAAKEAAELLMQERVEVRMARTSARREDIAENGFLTFRKGKNGGGVSAARGRDVVEGNYLGLTGAAYEEMPEALKAKSAFLAPKPGSKYSSSEAAAMYGDDFYTFKLGAVRSRMSLTAGDSLNRRAFFRGNTDDLEALTAWDQAYVPWGRRELLVPILASGLRDGKLGIPMYAKRESLNGLTRALGSARDLERAGYMPLSRESVERFPDRVVTWTVNDVSPFQGEGALEKYRCGWGGSLDYIEAQIWDRLTLEDVEAFEFTETPPAGKFLEALKKHGIEIRDGRKKPAAAESKN